MLKRPELSNLEAEQAIVGAVILEADSLDRIMDAVSPNDFTNQNLQTVYQLLVEMRLAGEPIDLVSVSSKLQEQDKLGKIGGPGFIASLSENVGSAKNIEFWGGLVKKQSILRQTYDMCYKTLTGIKPDADIDLLLGGLAGGCVDILSKTNTNKENPIHKVVVEIRERLEKIRAGAVAAGVPTGFNELDRKTGGFQPSDLIILAARPSMGKSALALNVAQHAAMFMGIPVGFFSLEMSKELAPASVSSQ